MYLLFQNNEKRTFQFNEREKCYTLNFNFSQTGYEKIVKKCSARTTEKVFFMTYFIACMSKMQIRIIEVEMILESYICRNFSLASINQSMNQSMNHRQTIQIQILICVCVYVCVCMCGQNKCKIYISMVIIHMGLRNCNIVDVVRPPDGTPTSTSMRDNSRSLGNILLVI